MTEKKKKTIRQNLTLKNEKELQTVVKKIGQINQTKPN